MGIVLSPTNFKLTINFIALLVSNRHADQVSMPEWERAFKVPEAAKEITAEVMDEPRDCSEAARGLFRSLGGMGGLTGGRYHGHFRGTGHLRGAGGRATGTPGGGRGGRGGAAAGRARGGRAMGASTGVRCLRCHATGHHAYACTATL